MAHRIDVKYAHAALLRRVGFERDPTQVKAARQRSMWYLDMCRSLLLDS